MGRRGDPALTATVTFEALPIQRQLFETARRGDTLYIGFGGGIRGTKTFGMLALLLTVCRLYPGSRWAVVRTDLPTLRRNTVPSYNKLKDEHFTGFAGEINQSEWTATCANGSQIIFFPESLDTDPDLGRWKGLEVNGFLLEEADELAERSFHKAIERAGAWILPSGQRQPPPYVLCTFNPNAAWPKRVFYEPWKHGTIQPPYAFIPATAADNPFIPDATREAWKNLPEQEYRRFVEGDWDVLTGRYYDSLNAQVHLIDRSELPARIPDWWEAWCAYDWGYAHWATMGLFVKDREGVIYLLDAYRLRKAQDAAHARAMVQMCESHGLLRALNDVYAGHDAWERRLARGASGVSTADVFQREGIAGLIKADTDKVNGGRSVRRALAVRDGRSGFYFVKQANGFPQMAFDQLAEIMPDENDVNKPAKIDADAEGRGGDDFADMVRYGLATRVPAAVEPDVKPVAGPDQDPWALVRLDDEDFAHGPMTHYPSGF